MVLTIVGNGHGQEEVRQRRWRRGRAKEEEGDAEVRRISLLSGEVRM